MTESNTNKLRQIIAVAARRKPRADEAEIVNFIFETESELVIEWARERLALLVRRETRTEEPLPDPGPYQMFLEGFASLEERLPLPGRGKPLAQATIVDLRRSLKMTRHKALEKSQRTAALIKEMAPYAKTRRDLTVERYCQLRASGVSPRAFMNERR
jgi:hypothetical protein